MKTNCWLLLGTMLATTAVAQVNTNSLPEIPAPAMVTPAPAAAVASTNAVAPVTKKKTTATHKKKAVKKISEPTVVLVPGPATVASPNLNLRGQAGLKGEVVGHVKAGDTVTVIAQINLDKHAADEPAQWAKILLPSGTKVWVNAKFVDAATKTVSAKKLNLRAGPGENYSVLGAIEKGTAVNEVNTKGDWAQIETPTNAFAFVAAMHLKQEPAPAPAPVEAAPVVAAAPPTTSTVPEAQPIVTPSPPPPWWTPTRPQPMWTPIRRRPACPRMKAMSARPSASWPRPITSFTIGKAGKPSTTFTRRPPIWTSRATTAFWSW